MDWITPIISSAGTFVTGLVINIGSSFSSLFVVSTYVVDHYEYAPTDLALFLLSMIGLTVGYFIIKFTYGVVARMIRTRKYRAEVRRGKKYITQHDWGHIWEDM